MNAGPDFLIATIRKRVDVRLARGIVSTMQYASVKIDRHQVLGREVGIGDAVRRDHEAVLIRNPNAEIPLGVLHQAQGLGPLGDGNDLATYLYFWHRHGYCLLSRFLPDTARPVKTDHRPRLEVPLVSASVLSTRTPVAGSTGTPRRSVTVGRLGHSAHRHLSGELRSTRNVPLSRQVTK
jgi:hypothetical protein